MKKKRRSRTTSHSRQPTVTVLHSVAGKSLCRPVNCAYATPELSVGLGLFPSTQPNPTHQIIDPTLPNPLLGELVDPVSNQTQLKPPSNNWPAIRIMRQTAYIHDMHFSQICHFRPMTQPTENKNFGPITDPTQLNPTRGSNQLTTTLRHTVYRPSCQQGGQK